MPNGQFVVGRGRLSNGPEVFVEQAQGGVLDQTFGVGAGIGGDLRELPFLLGCEMDFHALRILEKRPSGNGVERAGPVLRYPARHNKKNLWYSFTLFSAGHSFGSEADVTGAFSASPCTENGHCRRWCKIDFMNDLSLFFRLLARETRE